MTSFTQYRRKQIAELRPWQFGDDMLGISVSTEDFKAGSPKTGDMIARNPKNHADQWLVAAAYFADNFEPAAATPSKAEGGRGEPVAIKPLEWDKHPDEDEWFSHDHGLYDVSEYLVYKSPVSTTAWCLKVRGILLDEDFLGPDAAKAAAQSDYEARIRSALYTHPASPPDVEAIRADEREKHSDQICESLLVLSHGYINNPADDAIRIALSNASVFIFGKDRAQRIASAIRTGGQK